jgi:hypothetical protein
MMAPVRNTAIIADFAVAVAASRWSQPYYKFVKFSIATFFINGRGMEN